MYPFVLLAVGLTLCHTGLTTIPPPAYKCSAVNAPTIPAANGDFPYHVSIKYQNKHWCSGALIRPATVITAAYCTYRLNASSLKVGLGTLSHKGWGITVDVTEFTQHPLYNYITRDYDVAVLKLKHTPTPSNTIRPLRYSQQNIGFKLLALLTSWSQRRQPGGDRHEWLQQIYVPLMNLTACSWYYPQSLTERSLCAGYTTGGRESCFADRGSPLVVNNQLLGIYSWGDGCARPNLPGVYTSINSVLQFINSVAY